ncbi:uncharacterized protein [Gossypium hirsutum]|uniref:DUF674 family protein n=1 Tax=Gossypium hirsutum TaxID=3635 RepID=A0A1U8PMT7_GOSHI|nr:uncharacterized protein LOC107960705 [Gossypium hirsutum]
MDVSEPTKTYMCENVKCSERLVGLLSNYKTTKCSCGKLMSRDGSGREMDVVKDETKGESMFFITDGLVVMKGLPGNLIQFLHNWESRIFFIRSKKKFWKLIHMRTTLTDAFLRKQRILSGEKSLLVAPNMEETVENDVKTSVKIILRKSDWKISFAETNEDFVGLLFSFLTIPFDSVLELLLGSNLTIGSISYLLQDLNIMLSITEPKYSKKAVLQPFYSCPKEFPSICSEVRFSSFLDPKSPNPNSRYSSGYVLKNSSFLVTDDLVVKSVSSVSIISVLKELNIPLVDVEQLVISIGQFEALALLKACLCSSSPLSALKNYIVKKRKRKPLQ